MLALGRPDAASVEVVGDIRKRKLFTGLGLTPQEIPERFGRYVVLDELGSGGTGTVLKAYDEELDRAVAIKVLHPAVSDSAAGRLKREAQALAKLSHPNVVHVYEVGEIDGQTFVAMELVDGPTLAAWARRKPRPGWRECVQVYLQAGAGLASAHAEGLVHRDFKPGNAVIDDNDRVRVLDFGLARQAREPSQESSESLLTTWAIEGTTPDCSLTRTGEVMGTLAYMPLEQLDGKPVDARSDQFSFCVSLYEAVFGERPFAGGSTEELRSRLLEGPNTSIIREHAVPAKLAAVLLRGLATQPEDRWPSMDLLLRKLQQLVAARKKRWQVLGAVGGLVAIGAGFRSVEVMARCTGADARLAGIWNDARKQEVKAAILDTRLPHAPSTWEHVETRLDDYSRAWAGKYTEACEATVVRQEQSEEAMDLRMDCLQEHEAALHAAVNMLTNADEGVVENAVALVARLPEPNLCDAVGLLKDRMPLPENPDEMRELADLQEKLAEIDSKVGTGRVVEALAEIDPVVARAYEVGYMPMVAEATLVHGVVLAAAGRPAEAEQDLTSAYEMAMEHGDDRTAQLAATYLAHIVGYQQGRHAEGVIWGRVALSSAKHIGDTGAAAVSMRFLGVVLLDQGKHDQAEELLRDALEIQERSLGPNHPDVAVSLSDLARVLMEQGKQEEAERLSRRVLEVQEQVQGMDHPVVGRAATTLGDILSGQQRHREAEPLYRRALEIHERTWGPYHLDVAWSAVGLGETLLSQERYEEAEPLLRQALKIQQEQWGGEHHEVARAAGSLAEVLLMREGYEEAEQLFRQALTIQERVWGPNDINVAWCVTGLGEALLGQERYDEAEPLFRRALVLHERVWGAEDPAPEVWRSAFGLGQVLLNQGRYDEAEPLYKRALEIHERVWGKDDPGAVWIVAGLGEVFHSQSRYGEAEPLFRRALEIQTRARGTSDLDVTWIGATLGDVLLKQGQHEEARRLLSQALETRERLTDEDHPSLVYSLVRLAEIELIHRDFEAARVYAERAASIVDMGDADLVDVAEARFVLARALGVDTRQ